MQGIITEPKHILRELIASRESGRAIGIWAPSLGPGLSMCAVENILDDEEEHDKVIVLKDRDVRGERLPQHVLFLQEIEKVFSAPPREARVGGANGKDMRQGARLKP